MKTKISEATLMAYLYGELSATEKQEVEKHFQENPEAMREFKEMQAVKNTLGKITDKEVIAPPIFMDEKPTISLWQSGFFRYVTGIAAAFMIMMIGAKMLDVKMKYSGNEFSISFGEAKKETIAPGISPDQVQQMINASLNQNNNLVQESWNESQQKWSEALKKNSIFNSQQVNNMSKAVAKESQEEIRQFMETLRNENATALQDYIRLSSNDQKQYIETLLVDFSKYVQEQRKQDLNFVQTKINSIEEDNNLFRQEAGQILTSLVGNSNPEVKRN
jgi:hypothetical protein